MAPPPYYKVQIGYFQYKGHGQSHKVIDPGHLKGYH